MNPKELEILANIEAELTQTDATFVARMRGLRLSIWHRILLVLAALAGIALVMMFTVNMLLGVAGYLVLVAAGTNLLRHRRIAPIERSPLEIFHRLTGGLFRDPGKPVGMTD
jgi:predicted membrane metal-binding protein